MAARYQFTEGLTLYALQTQALFLALAVQFPEDKGGNVAVTYDGFAVQTA